MQEEEETDELLLMDEELFDAPPEDLPHRQLTDFSIYNAEVSMACSHAEGAIWTRWLCIPRSQRCFPSVPSGLHCFP
jgi:hypothetical protein